MVRFRVNLEPLVRTSKSIKVGLRRRIVDDAIPSCEHEQGRKADLLRSVANEPIQLRASDEHRSGGSVKAQRVCAQEIQPARCGSEQLRIGQWNGEVPVAI